MPATICKVSNNYIASIITSGSAKVHWFRSATKRMPEEFLRRIPIGYFVVVTFALLLFLSFACLS